MLSLSLVIRLCVLVVWVRPSWGIDINYRLSQPQILVNDGHIYLVPAEHRNLVLVANGTGKIIFNNLELNNLLSSIRNSTRDVRAVKRIIGTPRNGSVRISTRLTLLERAVSRLDELTALDSRLTTVERQITYNSTNGSGTREPNLRQRLRRLQTRVETIETSLQNAISLSNNPCGSNPCTNGGTCIPSVFGPFCLCSKGWEGERCQQDVNECFYNIGTEFECQNGGTCRNRPGYFICECRSGYNGKYCNKRGGGCDSDSNQNLCDHGICIDQHLATRPYTCLCDAGWKTDNNSPVCNVDINECTSYHATCSKDPPVACINTLGSFVCAPCPSGYTGNGHQCNDINECLIGNGGCSMNPFVQCINTLGSRNCGECPPGYMGNGMRCQYVGLCAMNNGGCHPLARCVENPVIGQSYVQCMCPAGYTGTGMGLNGCFQYQTPTGGGSAIGPAVGPTANPCASNPCVNGACQMFGNSFICSCFQGFTGANCGTRLDPCLSFPCQNRGNCTSNPLTPRGFYCRCPNDFTGELCEQQEESCGGTLSTEFGFLTYPHDQSQETYNHNANCVWTIRTTAGKVINITFTDFHLEGGSDCRYDKLQIHDGGDTSAQRLGTFCGNNLPNNGSIISTHNVIYLWFVSDESTTGLGFKLFWNTTDPICGGVIENQTHGAINSPGYPGKYPHDRDCVWEIRASFGKRIQLVFATMRLEVHSNCSYDFVEVRDGLEENAPVLQTFCNTTIPPPLTSSGNYLTIRFHSDYSDSDIGFHVTFLEVPGIPGCGGILTTPTGALSSPHHPEPYGHDMDCEWLIRLPEQSDRISLKFLTFELEGGSNCRYDHVEVRDGNLPTSPLVGRFCGRNLPSDYISTGNNLLVRFRSDESVTYDGFSAKYKTVCGGVFSAQNGILKSPYYPSNYPKDRECVYIISQPVGKAIRLDFMDFDLESGGVDARCYFDYLEVRDGDTENSTLIGHFCGPPLNIPDPILSSFNYLWIKFKTDGSQQNRGFAANYSVFDTGCGGILRDSHGLISSPGHPEVYPHGVQCTWVIRGNPGQVVRLTWVSFALERNAYCNYDRVEIFDNSTLLRNGSSMGKFCGSEMPPILTSSDTTMTIFFRSDHSVAHDGFMANYILLNSSTVCGANYFTEYGLIRSPRYPQQYPNSKTCVWSITVTRGQQIMLNITDFDLENGTNCRYDYLEIRNGGHATSPLIGKFCGNNLPPTRIPSFTNALYLKFSSDISHTRKGFQIFWDGTATGCGGKLTGPSGSLMSPGYPMSYSSHPECVWTIKVNKGSAIQLVFIDIDVSCWAPIEVRNGYNRNGELIGRYCSSDSHFITINSTDNALRIKYIGSYGTTGRGFHAKFQTLCSRTLEGFSGVIESPNFPKPYSHNRNCTWEIIAPVGNTVNISFSHFSVEGPHLENCSYDYVEIMEWDRNFRNAVKGSIGRYCGDSRPSLIASTKNTVSVRFVSDSTQSMNGFRLEWKISGCGGQLVGWWGTLSSPNWPRRYNNTVECLWEITTPIGTRVQLTISKMDIENHDTCVWDGLEVYGGPTRQSPILAKLCHNINSETKFQSHGNRMFVRFYSDSVIVRPGFFAMFHDIEDGCGARYTSPVGNVYSPNYPANYDHNADCEWLITVDRNHVVELEFTDFNVERHINCSYDYVAVYDGYSDESPQLLFHCGDTLPTPARIKASGNSLFIRLRTDDSSTGRGFKANYSTGCGARIEGGNRGELTSPFFPSFILPGTNCSWILIGSNPDDKVTVTFTHIDFSTSNTAPLNCSENFVRILDGEDFDAPELNKYCFGPAPPAITSQGNSLLVQLQAKRFLGLGFRAIYSFSSAGCGGDLKSAEGSFTTPNHPFGYPPNLECIWTISSSAGNQVQLSFRRMEIEQSDFCNGDYIEIHENSASGTLLGHFCGNEIPTNITASEKLWIVFRSDAEGNAPGFWGDYNLVHGVELSGSVGRIESPLYPLPNSVVGNFFWRVTVNESRVIQIAFGVFDFEASSAACSYLNYLKIFDGYDNEAPVLFFQCTGTDPEPITSTGNVVYIEFRKLSYHTEFVLSWSEIIPSSGFGPDGIRTNVTGCGGNVSISEANVTTIVSPGYPSSYPSNTRCTWYVTSPDHYKIKLQVESIDMEWHIFCYYDRVEIYDGVMGLPNYNLNKTLCSRQQNGMVLISSGRTIQITMVSDAFYSYSGFNFSLSTVCGGYLRERRGIITTPNYPLNYGHAICEWVIIVRPSRTIKITFDAFEVYRAGDGPCGTDIVILRNGGSMDSPFLGVGRYCGNTIPTIPESSDNQLYIKFVSYTAGGKGFSLKYEEISLGCGGEIHLTDDDNSFLFNSPNYPTMPPPYTECEWVFSAPHGEAIQVTFETRFEFISSYGCIHEGVELRDGGTELAPQLGLYCQSMPGTTTSSGNVLYFRYYTTISEPKIGFKAEAKIATCGGVAVGSYGNIMSPGFPTSYETNLSCIWTIKGPEGSSLLIEFYDLVVNTGNDPNCTKDRVVIKNQDPDLVNPRNWTLCGSSSSSLPNRIQTSSNEAQVIFYTDDLVETLKGFKLRYRASRERCGGTLNSPTGIIQSIGYPRPYPNSRYCSWRIIAPAGRRIRLEFLDFDLEERIRTSEDHYCVDAVTVYQGIWRDLPPLYNTSLCGPTLPGPVETTSNDMTIIFRSDSSDVHRGFKAKYTTDLPTICGGELLENNGTIMSPNVTTNTPNTTTNILCQWKNKRNSSSDGTIIVNIHSLRIPPWSAAQPFCPQGSIRVSPGGGYYRFSWRQLCGSLENIKVYLPGTYLNIDYEAAFTESTFNLTYQIVPCGGTINGGNVTSPNYPSNYPTSMECIWIVDADYGSQIQVTFQDVNMDDHMKDGVCDRDYVVIKNGRYPSSPELGRFCGSNIPSTLTSMSPSLWIEFHSDSNSDGTKRGFSILTEQIPTGCGGMLHQKYGKLRSPRIGNGNQRYPPNTECVWEIETIPGYVINVAFAGRFDLEISNNCTNDYVQIFKKVKNTWESIGKYCGKQIPAPINTTSLSIKVLFRTNEQLDGNGFELYWYSPCGGLFTEFSGIIRSAHYDAYNHSYNVDTSNYYSWMGWENTWSLKRCDYVIQGDPSDFIVVDFMQPFEITVPDSYGFPRDIGDNALCPVVNLTLWEGNGTIESSSHITGKFCGSNMPAPFVAKGAVTIAYNYRASYHNFGFKARYTKFKCGGNVTNETMISSPGHPFTSAPNMNCTWIISAPQDKVVRFKFETLDLEFHYQCVFDHVRLYDGSFINEGSLIGTYCGNLTEDFRRISSRTNTMTVQFFTDYVIQHSGFTAAIDFTLGEAQNCGGRFNISGDNILTIRSPDSNQDGKYDASLDCQWLIVGADFNYLELSFSTFNVEGGSRVGIVKNTNGTINADDACPFDYVEVRDGPGPYSQNLTKLCGSTTPPVTTSSQNFMWISFVSDGDYNFPGFTATIRNRPSACGPTVLNATSEVKYLESPNYPQNYPNGVRCKWAVVGAEFYDEVDIQFLDMEIESSQGCTKDGLEIRDVGTSYMTPEGVSGPTLFIGNGAMDWRFRYNDLNLNMATIYQDIKYCGQQIPPDFFSVGRRAEIVFHADNSGVGKGFRLGYKNAGCNRTYDNIQGRIFSPEWPAHARIYAACQYHISARNGSYISVYFNTFILFDSYDCSETAFQVRDGTPTGTLLAKYCGASLPSPVFSNTNNLYITFFTKFQLSRGFDITYTTTSAGVGCGGDIFHTGGSFTSPSYPGNYSQNSDCSWRIRVPASLRIQIVFTSFVIGPDCDTDFVELFSMDSHDIAATPTLFSRFCPGDVPSAYNGNTDMAMVRYKTSVNNTGNGWRAEFKAVSPTQST